MAGCRLQKPTVERRDSVMVWNRLLVRENAVDLTHVLVQ